MNRIDLTPLYRSSIGFDRFGSLIDAAFQTEKNNSSYPPYNIEVIKENHYQITLAVAGFQLEELNIQVENNILSVNGKKETESNEKQFLHQGIATRSFERKFNLIDHIEVTQADLQNGLLILHLVKEIPEAMKPKTIRIQHQTQNKSINANEKL